MTYDVVIAGGGPVGLFLACELGLRKISILVLERMEDPHSPLKAGWMGMRGLNFPSVEAFYRRGMLKDVRRSSLAWMDAGAEAGFRLGNAGNASGPDRASPATSPASCSMPTRSTSPTENTSSPDPAPPAAWSAWKESSRCSLSARRNWASPEARHGGHRFHRGRGQRDSPCRR